MSEVKMTEAEALAQFEEEDREEEEKAKKVAKWQAEFGATIDAAIGDGMHVNSCAVVAEFCDDERGWEALEKKKLEKKLARKAKSG